jgi:hypothetical protein
MSKRVDVTSRVRALQRTYHQCAARVYEIEKTVDIVFTLLAVLVILALAASGYLCCVNVSGGYGLCKPSSK